MGGGRDRGERAILPPPLSSLLHEKRTESHRDVCAALDRCPRESTGEQLRAQGVLAAPAGKPSDKLLLGSGVYGSVTEAVVAGHPVAVKHVPAALGRRRRRRQMQKKKKKNTGRGEDEDGDEDGDEEEEDLLLLGSLLREDVACAYLSGLVLGMVCPNFMLVHRGFISKNSPENKMEFLMISELAEGTLAQWLRSSRKKRDHIFGSPEQILPLVLQLCMAVCAATSALDIVHNDLYFKNVLWISNAASPSHRIRYALRRGGEKQQQRQQRYCVTSPILLLVGDLGISSSPAVLENDHDSLQRRMHSRKKVPGVTRLVDVRFDRHILEYVDLPPLKRDLAIVFNSFLECIAAALPLPPHQSGQEKVAPMARWLSAALVVLDDAAVETPNDVVCVVEAIFSRESLRAAGIREDIVHEDPALELAAGVLPPVYDVLRPDAHAVAQNHALEYILRSRETFASQQRVVLPGPLEGAMLLTSPAAVSHSRRQLPQLQTVRSPVSYRRPPPSAAAAAAARGGRGEEDEEDEEEERVAFGSAALILSVALDPMRI